MLTGAILVLFSTFFFLRDGRRIWRFIVRLFPVAARWRIDDAGQASWVTLGALRAGDRAGGLHRRGRHRHLPGDLPRCSSRSPLAALVFLGAFIPIVGATLSGAVAVLVALVDQGPVIALVILGVVIGVQQLEGHVLQPLIMGRAVAIHPLVVIIAIAAGVVLAGIVGALVAVPLVAVLNTGIRRLNKRRGARSPAGRRGGHGQGALAPLCLCAARAPRAALWRALCAARRSAPGHARRFRRYPDRHNADFVTRPRTPLWAKHPHRP